MEASLTCAVCLGLFEEPVTLPLCSHNFCRHCVQGCTSSPPAPLQQLCCPLCRKVSSVPGGAATLPVNTTLAEVVKLLRVAPCKEKEEVGAGPCLQHSGRQLLLYCRMCDEGVCGQCVSEKHQGPFHSINLLDITYQEEKLAFFSILKKLRDVGEKLSNEISEDPNDIEAVLQDQTEIVTTKFDEISKMLDLKRKQLLEYISNQRSKKMKEHQLWKDMKDVDQRTVVNLLQECEKIIDECDPQYFLKVACNLNKRMNTKLELLHISSGSVAAPQFKPSEIDIKPTLDAISALKIMEDHFRDPFSEKQESNKRFTFKKCTKRWKEKNDVSEKFRELRLKHYDNHRQVTNELTIDSVPQSKNATSLLPEREPKSNTPIFEKKSNIVKARDTRKGRSKLTKQQCLGESSNPNSSIASVSKTCTNSSEMNQKVDGLFASHQDRAHGFIFGERETKSITHLLDQAPSDKSPIQMPKGDSNSFLFKFPALPFTSNSIDASLTTDRDNESSAKEAPMNVSVHPSAHGDKSTAHDNGSNVPEHWCRMFSGPTSSSVTVSVASSDLANTKTEAAVAKSSFSFSFGDSKSSFSSFSANKSGNLSPFSCTVIPPLNPLEESAKVKMTSENKHRSENAHEGFSWPKVFAPGSKSQNSKSWTSLKGIAEMGADVKKTSAPSTAGMNISSFSSSSCATKPPYTSGFSFGFTSKNNSVHVPFSLPTLPHFSTSIKREEGKETEHLSSLALSNDEKSLSTHSTYSTFDAGLESKTLFPLSYNISKKPPLPCASFNPMFSTVQSTFTRESSLFSLHPVATTIRPQCKDTTEDNGIVSEETKLCSKLDSNPQIQDEALSQSECLSNPLVKFSKKESRQSVPLKEDSDVDEGNKDTSSSDFSSTSDETLQVEDKLEEENHSIGEKR